MNAPAPFPTSALDIANQPEPSQDTQGTQGAKGGHFEDLPGMYDTPDPDNAPNILQTTATVFGEQRGAGTDPDDRGGFAYGGRSTDNPEPYIALPAAWNKIVPPGYAVPIWNPENPNKVVWGIHRDLGPGAPGVGIDVAPNIGETLGLQGKGTVQFDPTQAKPMSTEDARAQLAAANADQSRLMASSAQSGGVQSTDTAAVGPEADTGSTPQAGVDKDGKIHALRYPDGSIDYGNGIRKFPNGIIQTESGNSTTQYIPDSQSPSGYKLHTFQTKTADKPLPPIPADMSADNAMKQLSPEDRAKVKLFANYDLPATSQYGRMNPDFSRLIAYVQKLNPDIDPSQYITQRQTKLQYASQAPTAPGRAITAANQALIHLNTLHDFAKDLGGSDYPNIQAIENYIKTKGGAPQVTNFTTMRTMLATELARALQQGAPTQGQIKDMEAYINENLGTAQLRSQLLNVIPKMMEGQLEALNGGYKRVMRKDIPDNDLLYEDSRKALQNLGIKKFANREIGEGAPTASGTPSTLTPDALLEWAKSHPNDPRAKDVIDRVTNSGP